MNGWRKLMAVPAIAVAIAGSVSCGDVVRQGRSPVYLIVDSITAARGAATVGTFVSPLASDVMTGGTVYADPARAVMRVAEKNVNSATAPTTNNDITVSRVHVAYRRTDGLNTPGVDVPYPFDQGVT